MRTHPRPVSSLTLRPARLAFWLALLAGCAPGADLPPPPAYSQADYRLGAGDQIRVITYQQDQLTDDFRLSDNGNVELPLLGPVHAEGLTAEELGTLIARDLRDRKMLRAANVSVEVTAYRPISVLGEVTRPGEYPYRPRETMLAAVAAAGGFTYRAVQSYGSVIRQDGGKSVQAKLKPGDYVAPGDVIKIYERTF